MAKMSHITVWTGHSGELERPHQWVVDADGGVCGGFGDRADGGDGLVWSMLVHGAAGVHHVVTDETGRSPHVVLVRGRRRVERCDAVCLGQNLGGLRGLGRGFLVGHALSALQAAGMAALVVLMGFAAPVFFM